MKEIKCPTCNTWNTDVEFCRNCGQPLTAKQLNIQYRKEIDEEDSKRPPSKIELYMAKQMKSENLLIRGVFYFLYSVWVVYMAVVGFFVYMIIGTPG
jgi:uncharacterized membrane protein YvbJ